MSARAFGLAALVALSGCFFHREPRPGTMQGEWAQARNGATRRAFLYDGFKHRATATATYLSPAVREAQARRLGEWFDWTPQELEQRLAKERADAAAGEEFVLDVYTADPRANDLDAPRSIWRVAVKADGADVLATRVTGIERDATVLELYPYIGPFDVVYRVSVPFAPGGPLAGREFTLEVTSALGRLPLDFGKPDGDLTPQEVVPPP